MLKLFKEKGFVIFKFILRSRGIVPKGGERWFGLRVPVLQEKKTKTSEKAEIITSIGFKVIDFCKALKAQLHAPVLIQDYF